MASVANAFGSFFASASPSDTAHNFSGSSMASAGSSPAAARSASAKAAISSRLVASIKELQAEKSHKDTGHVAVQMTGEATNGLCYALEALFLHGSKQQSSIFGKIMGGSGASTGQLPDNNFWLYVMIFSHKDTLKRIEQLRHVTTDVGRCRAWLRLALNDGLLASYMAAMVKDKRSARQHYDRSAFVRDPEALDIATKYVLGVEVYKFDLPLNASLLNKWQTPPLIMAGLWIPDHVPETLPAVGVDVLEALEEEEKERERMEQNRESIPPEIRPLVESHGLLNEEEALNFILRSSTMGRPILMNTTSTSRSSDSIASQPISPASSFQAKDEPPQEEEDKTLTSPVSIRIKPKKRSKDRQKKKLNLASTPMSPLATPRPSQEVESPESSLINPVPEKSANCSVIDSLPSVSSAADLQNQHPEQAEDNSPSRPEPDSPGDKHETSEEQTVLSTPETGFSEPTSSNTANMDTASDLDSSINEESIYTRHRDYDSAAAEDLDVDASGEAAPSYRLPDLVEKICETLEEQTRARSASRSPPVPMPVWDSDKDPAEVALPHLSGFIDSWNPFGSGKFFDTPPASAEAPPNLGFSLKPNVSVGSLSVEDSQYMMGLFDQIPRELGLDHQNYQCHGCSKSIGTLFGPAKICAYSKMYYCEECHSDDIALLPAKVVFNWDFNKYRICKKAKIFLDAIFVEPIVDVKSFNSTLFQFATDLDEIFTLRKQLHYMHAYLKTCRYSEGLDKFTKILWPREYLFSAVDAYSMREFEQIQNGQLKLLLRQAAHAGEQHIVTCVLCSGKGFICEVCKADQPIYPFDLGCISQCKKCFQVFHLECSARLTSCPRCDRREARGLNWLVRSSRMQREIPINS